MHSPRVRRRFWLLLALAATGAGAYQLLFNVSAAGANHDTQVTITAVSGPHAAAPAATVTIPTSASHVDATVTIAPAPAIAVPSAETTQLTVHRGESLARLFATHHLNAADLHTILMLGGDIARLKLIHPGQVITVSHNARGGVLSLSMQLDDAHTLEVERGASSYRVSIADIPTQTSIAYAHGVIENSLFDAASRAGLSDSVTMNLIHLFGWDIDFAHDIRSGDSFTVMYQKTHRQGQPVMDGPILAAEFVTPDRAYRIARFTDPAGHTDYYTPDGRSVRKALLRAPVAFTRISSGFSLHRMNPVLHYVRPHYGVDYAAPTGTPIKAAGDGRIVFLGRKEGYGRCVVIDHGGGYNTLYAHMSNFRGSFTPVAVSSRTRSLVIGHVRGSHRATSAFRSASGRYPANLAHGELAERCSHPGEVPA